MKRINCLCGRTIEVRGGVFGDPKPFPQEIYICACGYAYIPQNLGCCVMSWDGNGSDLGEPEILSQAEYTERKKEILYAATQASFPTDKAVVEIVAKTLSQ